MSRDAGVVRDAGGLTRLLGLIDDLQAEHGEALPLVAARLVAAPACARRESRGGHYRADYPQTDPVAERTLLTLDELGRRPLCVAAE
jgi:L-aspartate oxidase